MVLYQINWRVICGVLIAAVGVLLSTGWPTLFHLYRRHMMVLTNRSMSFNIWQKLPIPLYTEFYLYNISNMNDILAGKKVKLRVQQMGPYVFRETQSKENIVWNANGTVSYQMRRVWHYQPDRSNGSLSDMVTNINPIIPTSAYVMRNEYLMLQMLANTIIEMNFSNIFITANASCWLFDGIDSQLLDIAMKIPNFRYHIPFNKIGWLYQRNGSADYEGWFVMNTGADDFWRFGKTELWRHSNHTAFPGSCGEVHGSTGELWAPKKDQPEISFFASDLHRVLTLPARGPVTIHGIEGMLFVSNDSLFDNGQKYPSKACFCQDTPDDCMPSGVMNASECAYGAPLYVTQPHLRNVGAYYADKVDGMEPNEDHDFKMALEIVTGMPLMVTGQIQVNVLVRHNSWLRINNQLPDPDTLVPMVWVRQHATVDDSYANFASRVLAVYYIMPYVFYLFIATGVVVLSTGLWMIKYPKAKRADLLETHNLLTNSLTIKTQPSTIELT